MTYRETLPPSCPPSNPSPPVQTVLWRLLSSSQVTIADFDSQYKKKPTRNFRDPCTARSVSLITELEVCRTVAKSPRYTGFTHAVAVTHDPSSGVWDHDHGNHVNWWPYSSADPLAQVGSVENL